jgi:CheY-like chemotaxis protein
MSTDGRPHTPEVRVLIVDDDAALRRMVTMVLEDAGWQVLAAKDGLEALAAVRSSPCQLVVLLDWRMPEMSGEQVLEIIAATPELAARHAYALITANVAAMTPHLEDLLSRLDVTMIAKPFSIRELLCTVEQQAHRISTQEATSEYHEVR